MKIKIAFTDIRLPKKAVAFLASLGFKTITLPPFSKLGEAVASHADMLIHLSENTVFSFADYYDEYPSVFDSLYGLISKSGASFSFLSDEVAEKYPLDAGLNVLVIGKTVYARTKSASASLLEHYREKNYKIVDVKQGYPACTVMKIGESAAVTSDAGMARALSNEGIKTLLIEVGGIALPPYEYGFIGGCAGCFDDKIYFAGCIEDHPAYNLIKDFAENEGYTLVSLGDFPLFDVGGILLAEYDLGEDGEYGNQ